MIAIDFHAMWVILNALRRMLMAREVPNVEAILSQLKVPLSCFYAPTPFIASLHPLVGPRPQILYQEAPGIDLINGAAANIGQGMDLYIPYASQPQSTVDLRRYHI